MPYRSRHQYHAPATHSQCLDTGAQIPISPLLLEDRGHHVENKNNKEGMGEEEKRIWRDGKTNKTDPEKPLPSVQYFEDGGNECGQ